MAEFTFVATFPTEIDKKKENPIYQTINFLRIVTVILLKVLRMLLQSLSPIFLLFLHASRNFCSVLCLCLLHYPFANTASFARLYFFDCDPEVLHFSSLLRRGAQASSLSIILCNKKGLEIKYLSLCS